MAEHSTEATPVENEGENAYRVHVYAGVRVRFKDIDPGVGSAQAAAKYVSDRIDLHRILDRQGLRPDGELTPDYVEQGDGVQGFLVDVPNDPTYERSETFGTNAEGPMVLSMLQAESLITDLANMSPAGDSDPATLVDTLDELRHRALKAIGQDTSEP